VLLAFNFSPVGGVLAHERFCFEHPVKIRTFGQYNNSGNPVNLIKLEYVYGNTATVR